MSAAHVIRYSELDVADWGKGVSARLIVGKPQDADTITTGTTHFAPGSSLPMHTHNCDEVVTVIEGEARAEVNGVSHDLTAYDTTFVPQGIAHRFVNRGAGQMSILWSYPSGHVTRTLIESGITIDDLTPPN